MLKETELKVMNIAKYTLETEKTVRAVAKEFGISRSTVYRYLTEHLPDIDFDLADQVEIVLQKNKAARHSRGGQAVKRKFERMKAEGII